MHLLLPDTAYVRHQKIVFYTRGGCLPARADGAPADRACRSSEESRRRQVEQRTPKEEYGSHAGASRHSGQNGDERGTTNVVWAHAQWSAAE